MLRNIVRFFNLIHIGFVYLAKAMIVAMVLINFVNVILRYGFNSGLPWSEELSRFLAIWFIFIAMGLGVKQNLHINLSLFREGSLPRWLERTLELLKSGVALVVGLVLLFTGASLTKIMMGSILPATQWPTGLMYLVVPLGSIIIIYESLMDILGIDTRDAAVDAMFNGTGSFKQAMGGPDA
jgi:TRAP-type C4-dicarboxylate transport system permease small subunit